MAVRKFNTTGIVVAKEFKPAHGEGVIEGRKYDAAPDKFYLHILVGERDEGKKLFYELPPVVLSAEVSMADYVSVDDSMDVNVRLKDNDGKTSVVAIEGMEVKSKEDVINERLSSVLAAAGYNKLNKTKKETK